MVSLPGNLRVEDLPFDDSCALIDVWHRSALALGDPFRVWAATPMTPLRPRRPLGDPGPRALRRPSAACLVDGRRRRGCSPRTRAGPCRGRRQAGARAPAPRRRRTERRRRHGRHDASRRAAQGGVDGLARSRPGTAPDAQDRVHRPGRAGAARASRGPVARRQAAEVRPQRLLRDQRLRRTRHRCHGARGRPGPPRARLGSPLPAPARARARPRRQPRALLGQPPRAPHGSAPASSRRRRLRRTPDDSRQNGRSGSTVLPEMDRSPALPGLEGRLAERVEL